MNRRRYDNNRFDKSSDSYNRKDKDYNNRM